VLALPEGAKPSANALMSFARLDGANRLLGGRVAAFDMRAADRIYLRVPGRAADETAAKTASAAARVAQKKAEAKPKAKAEEKD
jgi:cell division protein FtsQ